MNLDLTRRLKSLISWIGSILLVLFVVLVGELLPLMPAVQQFQETHPSINHVLTIAAVVMTAIGTLLLALTQFLVRVPGSGQTIRTEGRSRGKGWFFTGKMVSAGFSDEARMWRVRKAFGDGEWWRVPRWRRMTLMMSGAILLFYGLFGLLFLLFPPGVKFLLFLVVVYATVRSIYAFAVDQPTKE